MGAHRPIDLNRNAYLSILQALNRAKLIVGNSRTCIVEDILNFVAVPLLTVAQPVVVVIEVEEQYISIIQVDEVSLARRGDSSLGLAY